MHKHGISRYAPRAIILLCAVLLIFSGCRTTPPPKEAPPEKTPRGSKSYRINGQWYHPITDSDGFRQAGLASWYGNPFHGRKTASGEVYNMYKKTAAHKILPMDTYVLVRNRDNGKESVVRINDRGPFVRGRVIDLSYRAAEEIDMIGSGTAKVEVIAMEKGPAGSGGGEDKDFLRGDFTVQVGAFASRSSAENLKQKLLKDYKHVTVTPVKKDTQTLYRVRVGRFSSLENAEKSEDKLVEKGHKNAFAVAADDG
ncbi:MAG: septal ring lytic transglycosylase RlpA family protein [Desulfobacterales bacterium]